MRGPRPATLGTRDPRGGRPRQKWLSDFDFAANPNVVSAVINNLAT
ncbi:hypothetical protein ACFCYM_35265 [Streptomyces sp. NPDC056254]